MRFVICICLLCLLCLLLAGCAPEAVDLMPTASPEDSALGLYIYDGQTITRQHLFETASVRKTVLEDFRKAKAEPVDLDVTTLQPPCYGLEVGSTEIGSVYGLWVDGYFIMDDGAAYKLEYDFGELLETYPWSEADTFSSLSVMPCASHMARTEAGWNRNFLTPAAELPIPEGITMELTAQTEDSLTVRYENRSGAEWGYGYSFQLQALLEETWYVLPAEQEMMFNDLLLLVPDGGEAEETYNLSPYGKLPAGTYRLVAESGLWAEFEVE